MCLKAIFGTLREVPNLYFYIIHRSADHKVLSMNCQNGERPHSGGLSGAEYLLLSANQRLRSSKLKLKG
jgi:hypothetical protein